MYNGIGLSTPRGSGTNGYVQRNLAFVKPKKERIDYKSEDEINKLDQGLNKEPNREILEHERKRKVELKCMEMQELMEEQGYSEKEVADKVNMFRKMLMAKEGVSESSTVEKDQFGRPLAKETHQLAEANQEKNARLKEAFGLTDYVDGTAFDPDRKVKEEAARAAAMASKKYMMVDSSDEDAAKGQPSSPARKKKKSRQDSTSPEHGRDKHRKRKKHSKRDRTHSRRHMKRRDSSLRSREKKKKRKRQESSSSSGSGSDSLDESVEEQKREPSIQVQASQPNFVSGNLQPTHKPAQTAAVCHDSDRTYQAGDGGHTGDDGIADKDMGEVYSGREQMLSRRSRSSSRSQSGSNSVGRHSYRGSSTQSSYSRSRSPSPSASDSSGGHSKGRDDSHRDSRSPSIRRRRGSPSHLDKRRITRSRSPSRRSSTASHSRSGSHFTAPQQRQHLH